MDPRLPESLKIETPRLTVDCANVSGERTRPFGKEQINLGSELVQNYNVMGVAKAALEASVRYLANDLGPQGARVNAISAGPIKTLASSVVGGISSMIKLHAERALLRKPVETGEVGDAALFLLSPLSGGITGEVIYVDGGYYVLGV